MISDTPIFGVLKICDNSLLVGVMKLGGTSRKLGKKIDSIPKVRAITNICKH